MNYKVTTYEIRVAQPPDEEPPTKSVADFSKEIAGLDQVMWVESSETKAIKYAHES